MKYYFGGISLQNKRPSNMDSLFLKSRLINGDQTLLAVVCDGVGSLASGGFASGSAVRMLNEWFDKLADTSRVGLRMRNVILEANSYIIYEAKRSNVSTASTLTSLLLIESTYHIAHIGDSRLYSYDGNDLSTLTNDDVSISGKLTGFIGRSENIVIQYYEGVSIGRTFVLCSDGLYKRMDTGFMIGKLKTLNRRTVEETLADLANYAIDHGERDNISIALVKAES